MRPSEKFYAVSFAVPFQLPSYVLSGLLSLFFIPLFLLEGYNNILFLVAPFRTGRHLTKNLSRVNIILHIFCQTIHAFPAEYTLPQPPLRIQLKPSDNTYHQASRQNK